MITSAAGIYLPRGLFNSLVSFSKKQGNWRLGKKQCETVITISRLMWCMLLTWSFCSWCSTRHSVRVCNDLRTASSVKSYVYVDRQTRALTSNEVTLNTMEDSHSGEKLYHTGPPNSPFSGWEGCYKRHLLSAAHISLYPKSHKIIQTETTTSSPGLQYSLVPRPHPWGEGLVTLADSSGFIKNS